MHTCSVFYQYGYNYHRLQRSPLPYQVTRCFFSISIHVILVSLLHFLIIAYSVHSGLSIAYYAWTKRHIFGSLLINAMQLLQLQHCVLVILRRYRCRFTPANLRTIATRKNFKNGSKKLRHAGKNDKWMNGMVTLDCFNHDTTEENWCSYHACWCMFYKLLARHAFQRLGWRQLEKKIRRGPYSLNFVVSSPLSSEHEDVAATTDRWIYDSNFYQKWLLPLFHLVVNIHCGRATALPSLLL